MYTKGLFPRSNRNIWLFPRRVVRTVTGLVILYIVALNRYLYIFFSTEAQPHYPEVKTDLNNTKAFKSVGAFHISETFYVNSLVWLVHTSSKLNVTAFVSKKTENSTKESAPIHLCNNFKLFLQLRHSFFYLFYGTFYCFYIHALSLSAFVPNQFIHAHFLPFILGPFPSGF